MGDEGSNIYVRVKVDGVWQSILLENAPYDDFRTYVAIFLANISERLARLEEGN